MGSSSILKYDPFRRHLLDISSGRGLVRIFGVAQVESVLKLLKLVSRVERPILEPLHTALYI